MLTNELNFIHTEVDEFLSKNKEKYEIFTQLQNNLYQLNEESYSNAIQLINDNKIIFFSDHINAIFFFCIVIRSSRFNFKHFELNLDIIIHFSSELKSCNTTEYELIGISASFYNSLNYLFSKNFFTISSIVKHSICDTFIFINFLPEITEYDPEYSAYQKQNIFKKETHSKLSSFFVRDPYMDKNCLEEYLEIVESDPQKHILNRNLNYHPSVLHKSIREDDIDTFQSLLYKNNIDVDYRIENSYYERAKTIDDKMSLIQIASIYGSLKIFKFLWNNEKIFIDDNLLCYAYCGYNFDIIHLCETKCSFDSVYLQPIALHQYNLLDYFIENFSDKIIENNDKIKNVLKNFVEDENNAYQTYLNNSSIEMAFYSVNFTVVLSCLEKIVFIARNQKNVEFSDEKKSPNKTGFIFEKMMNKISMKELMTAVRFYNEEIVVKMIRLYDFFNDNENISIFIIKLMKTISTKMMISLLKELSFLPKDKIMIMIQILRIHNIITEEEKNIMIA